MAGCHEKQITMPEGFKMAVAKKTLEHLDFIALLQNCDRGIAAKLPSDFFSRDYSQLIRGAPTDTLALDYIREALLKCEVEDKMEIFIAKLKEVNRQHALKMEKIHKNMIEEHRKSCEQGQK